MRMSLSIHDTSLFKSIQSQDQDPDICSVDFVVTLADSPTLHFHI
jgi:hypothetical protein